MPTLWQWFFAVIGGLAFLMAMPYSLQLLFGQPKIGFSFDHDDSGNDGRLLKIHLMNMPISSRVLQAFRVSRLPAQDMWLSIQLFNASTREVILGPFVPDIALSPSSRASRVTLPPSSLMASVSLVQWQRSTDSAALVEHRRMALPKGVYGVIIGTVLNNKTRVGKPMLFHIGKAESEMMWDQAIKNKLWI